MKWKPVYLEYFSDGIDMLRSFNMTLDDLGEFNIAVACYEAGGYDGDAYVLLWKREWVPDPQNPGRNMSTMSLHEVHGSHCSCYGLEGQWEPDRTTIKAIRKRMKDGQNYGALPYAETKIKKFLTMFSAYLREYNIPETPLPEVKDEIT